MHILKSIKSQKKKEKFIKNVATINFQITSDCFFNIVIQHHLQWQHSQVCNVFS